MPDPAMKRNRIGQTGMVGRTLVRSNRALKGKIMVKFHTNMHRTMFACTASVLALTMATPAFAQAIAATAATADGGSGQAAADPQTDATDDIVITGIRASLQAALDAKRNANAIIDSVSAEDIGKFPNTNVAEALTLVPGVT